MLEEENESVRAHAFRVVRLLVERNFHRVRYLYYGSRLGYSDWNKLALTVIGEGLPPGKVFEGYCIWTRGRGGPVAQTVRDMEVETRWWSATSTWYLHDIVALGVRQR